MSALCTVKIIYYIPVYYRYINYRCISDNIVAVLLLRQHITIRRNASRDFKLKHNDFITEANAVLTSTQWGQQEVHEYEASGGGFGRRLYCRLTSLSRILQINLRINLDGDKV